MGTDGACNRECSKAEQRNLERDWEVLTTFNKNNKYEQKEKAKEVHCEFELLNFKIHNARIQPSKVNQKSKFPWVTGQIFRSQQSP